MFWKKGKQQKVIECDTSSGKMICVSNGRKVIIRSFDKITNKKILKNKIEISQNLHCNIMVYPSFIHESGDIMEIFVKNCTSCIKTKIYVYIDKNNNIFDKNSSSQINFLYSSPEVSNKFQYFINGNRVFSEFFDNGSLGDAESDVAIEIIAEAITAGGKNIVLYMDETSSYEFVR